LKIADSQISLLLSSVSLSISSLLFSFSLEALGLVLKVAKNGAFFLKKLIKNKKIIIIIIINK